MKATLEIPDPILRKAKMKAAQRGIPLRRFVAEAVPEKLAGRKSTEKPLRSLDTSNQKTGSRRCLEDYDDLAVPVIVLGEFPYGVARLRRSGW